jgi:hypothetical protein
MFKYSYLAQDNNKLGLSNQIMPLFKENCKFSFCLNSQISYRIAEMSNEKPREIPGWGFSSGL